MSDFLEDKAELAEDSGDLDKALRLWRELAIRNQDAVFFCRYGRVAQRLERWTEAETAFQQALQVNPTLSSAMECMGSLWLSRLDKERDESLRTARDWFLLALKHERNPGVLTFLGSVEAALENEQAARPLFEEAISLNPNYEEALFNLASIEKHDNPEKAISLLCRALEIDPQYVLAHRELGVLLHRAGNLEEAEYHLRRALELDPADYWAQMYLANLLGVQGRNDEAEQMYRFATTLHPEVTDGIEVFARFLDSVGKTKEAAAVREHRTE
jgi:tetratricopeptide (TPR) repeat protein